MSQTAAQAPSIPGAVHAGLSASVSLTVSETDTAASLRSGDVDVLGTPRLVALCEQASCRALEGRLGPEHTSVGSRLQFDHLLPVPVGSAVKAEATLEKVEGRRLIFTVTVALDAEDRAALVAAGRLTRVVVHRPAFLAKVGRTGCGAPADAAAPADGSPADGSPAGGSPAGGAPAGGAPADAAAPADAPPDTGS